MNPAQPPAAERNRNAAPANLPGAQQPEAQLNVRLQHVARAVAAVAAETINGQQEMPAMPAMPPIPPRRPIQREVAQAYIGTYPNIEVVQENGEYIGMFPNLVPVQQVWGANFLQTSPGPIPELGQDLGRRVDSRNDVHRAIVENITDDGRIVYRGSQSVDGDSPVFRVAHMGPFAPRTVAEYRERLNRGDTFA